MEMERDNRIEQEQEVGLANNHGNALNTESDLIDHVDVAVAVEDLVTESDEDYSHYTKEQFAELIKEISKGDNFKHADTIIRKIKPLYDDIRGKEKSEAHETAYESNHVANPRRAKPRRPHRPAVAGTL